MRWTATRCWCRASWKKEAAAIVAHCSQQIAKGITCCVSTKRVVLTLPDDTPEAALVRSVVLGQIRPGIPVWQTGAESLFPGTPYIIFPGNVGEVSTLREAVEILLG